MAQLIEVIGQEAAQKLARAFGGTTISVPKVPGEHHMIRAVLGDDDTARLVSYCGGGRIYVPRQAERRARARALYRVGALTVAAIAIETGFSERHVYRLTQGDRDPRQLDFFDDYRPS
jgi:hypothetical protein